MNKLATIIGSLVIAILFILIPMLAIVSIVNNWNGLIRWILCIITLWETGMVACVVLERSGLL